MIKDIRIDEQSFGAGKSKSFLIGFKSIPEILPAIREIIIQRISLFIFRPLHFLKSYNGRFNPSVNYIHYFRGEGLFNTRIFIR